MLSGDSFSRGVVRSDTDYSVYAPAGKEGLDFAFYRGRSRYHTKYDSIPGMAGGKKALWAMMEGTHGASVALANRDNFHVQPHGQRDRPVYFDRKYRLVTYVWMKGSSLWHSLRRRARIIFARGIVHHQRRLTHCWTHSATAYLFAAYHRGHSADAPEMLGSS